MTKDEQIEQLQTQINVTRMIAAQPINAALAATFQLRLVDLERQMLELIRPE